MAALGEPSSQEGLVDQLEQRLSHRFAGLVDQLNSVNLLLAQQHEQVLNLLEGAKRAAEPTGAKASPMVATPPTATTPTTLRVTAQEELAAGRVNVPEDEEIWPPPVPHPGALLPHACTAPLNTRVVTADRSSSVSIEQLPGQMIPDASPTRPVMSVVRSPHQERNRRVTQINGIISNLRRETAYANGGTNGFPGTLEKMDDDENDSIESITNSSQVQSRPTGTSGTASLSRSSSERLATGKPPRATKIKHGIAVADEAGFGTRAVFVDREEMKQRVRDAIGKPPYSVTQYYKQHGCAQEVARSHWFENITLGVIAFNALWIGFDTDLNNDDTWLEAHPVFSFMENAFCVYFLIELMIRYCAFELKRNCLKDSWFVFDALLVLLMVAETWVLILAIFIATGGKGSSGGGMKNMEVLRLVRLLRLTRMARLARVLRATPELMVLIKGMAVGFRSVCSTLTLMTLIVYLFSIVFRMMGKDTNLEELGFRTVPQTMTTLVVRGVLDMDLYSFTYELVKVEIVYVVLLYVFILFASITVMNMLVGVLVEVVGVVSSVEKEQIEVNFVRDNLMSIVNGMDEDGDGTISKDEFKDLLLRPEAVRSLLSIDVDVVGLIDFTDYIFESDQPITFGQFMELLLQLRGSNKATVKDMVDMRKVIMQEFARLQNMMEASITGMTETLRTDSLARKVIS